MKLTRYILIALAVSAAAWFAAWRWAVAPIRFARYYVLGKGVPDVEAIRRNHPIRLIDPGWFYPGWSWEDAYVRWMEAETTARLGVILISWSVVMVFLLRRASKTSAINSVQPTTGR